VIKARTVSVLREDVESNKSVFSAETASAR
jgi:hypothetical protein